MPAPGRIEPPVEAVHPRPRLGEVVRPTAITLDIEVIIRLCLMSQRQVFGGLRQHILVKILRGEDLLPIPVSTIAPEPDDSREVPHRGIQPPLPVELQTILELESPKPRRVLNVLFRVSREDMIEQCLLIELDRKVIVSPRCARRFRSGIPARHRPQMPKRHRPILGRQLPAKVNQRLIDALHATFLNREEQHRAEHRLGRRKPVADLRLIAPALHDMAISNHTASPTQTLRQFIELPGIKSQLSRGPLTPGSVRKNRLRRVISGQAHRATYHHSEDKHRERHPRNNTHSTRKRPQLRNDHLCPQTCF